MIPQPARRAVGWVCQKASEGSFTNDDPGSYWHRNPDGSGLKGLGAYLGRDDVRRVGDVHADLTPGLKPMLGSRCRDDAGIDTIDTANVYSEGRSEQRVSG